MLRFLCLLAAALILATPAVAQLDLPGAVPTASDQPAGATSAPAKPTLRKIARRVTAPTLKSVVRHPLRLNGGDGELDLSEMGGSSETGKGKDNQPLRVDRFTLMGEVVSNPSQKCRIDIVGESPLEAKPQGAPDGLLRYEVAIPACPLTFDVLNGSVLAPQQSGACVFQAADCQASPGGLWGPGAGDLEKDAKALEKERSRADASVSETIRALQKRDKGGFAELEREQADFASQREDVCRNYLGEGQFGFCATRLTEARAALLHKRLLDLKKAAEGDE